MCKAGIKKKTTGMDNKRLFCMRRKKEEVSTMSRQQYSASIPVSPVAGRFAKNDRIVAFFSTLFGVWRVSGRQRDEIPAGTID